MKNIFRPLAFATLLVASTGVFAQETPKEIFSDNFDKSSFTKKNWEIDKDTKTSSVKFVKEGADKSRCLKITNSEKGVVKITKHPTIDKQELNKSSGP